LTSFAISSCTCTDMYVQTFIFSHAHIRCGRAEKPKKTNIQEPLSLTHTHSLCHTHTLFFLSPHTPYPTHLQIHTLSRTFSLLLTYLNTHIRISPQWIDNWLWSSYRYPTPIKERETGDRYKTNSELCFVSFSLSLSFHYVSEGLSKQSESVLGTMVENWQSSDGSILSMFQMSGWVGVISFSIPYYKIFTEKFAFEVSALINALMKISKIN